jgi:hypothetical protein
MDFLTKVEFGREVTPQEVFDQAASVVLRQKRKAINSNMGCAYRGDESAMCGVGACIPDSFYSPSIEGYQVGDIDLPVALHEHLGLLVDIQNAHDEQAAGEGFVRDFYADMRKIAENRGLDTVTLDRVYAEVTANG